MAKQIETRVDRGATAFDQHTLRESRICFALKWYDDEITANQAAEYVKAQGYTYNGGFFHEKPCGREPSFDFEKNGKKLYAVSY
jgi:hypothetical protein